MADKSKCAKLYKKGSKLYKACVSAKGRTTDPATESMKKAKKKGKSFSPKSPFPREPRAPLRKKDIMGTGGVRRRKYPQGPF